MTYPEFTQEQIETLVRLLDEQAPAISTIGALDRLTHLEFAELLERLANSLPETDEGMIWQTVFDCAAERLRVLATVQP